MNSPTAPSRPRPSSLAMRKDIDVQAAALARFVELQSQCIDPDTFDAADFELWHALDDHARQVGAVLDLRSHGQALVRVPAELMEAFFNVCRVLSPPLQVVYLPNQLSDRTEWLDACPDGALIVREAEVPA